MQSLTVQEQSRDLISFRDSDVKLIRDTVAKDLNEQEFMLFMYQCKKTGLDPLAKQIYGQKRGGKLTIITGIDGYRLVGERTGQSAGSDDAIFDNEESPSKATVTVYKLVGGIRCPYTASARWSQYYPGDAAGQMWRKMPHHMLAKCAEALALRKAFPAELSGVFTKEEMEQAGTIDVTPGNNEAPPPRDVKQATPAAAPKPVVMIYDDENVDMQTTLAGHLRDQKVAPSLWEDVGRRLHGRPASEWKRAIAESSKGEPLRQ